MRVWPSLLPGLVLGGIVLCTVSPARGETSSELSTRALAECGAGRDTKSRDARFERFRRGQQLAEQAIGLDDRNADAHFALFCNMGELMRVDGESVQALAGLGKLMRELDRTLELQPDHADAMASKGQLLMRLPRLFGGNQAEGEQLLRRVIKVDPTAFSSRLMIAKACTARGEREEAELLARRALEIAREQGRDDRVAEAQAILAKLDAR